MNLMKTPIKEIKKVLKKRLKQNQMMLKSK